MQTQLDELDARSVVVDARGDAWQCGGIGRAGMFWYRAFDGEGISSFELAQRARSIDVVLDRAASETGEKS